MGIAFNTKLCCISDIIAVHALRMYVHMYSEIVHIHKQL